MKQTAVEWLLSRYIETNKLDSSDVLQAKEMERMQILDAFSEGASDGFYGESDSNKEQYYNETYKQDT